MDCAGAPTPGNLVSLGLAGPCENTLSEWHHFSYFALSVATALGAFSCIATEKSPNESNTEADLPRQVGEEVPVCAHAEVAGE